MYGVGIVIFSACLCSIRGKISYKVFQSDNDPSVLKMKVGGSIEVPSSELFNKYFRLYGNTELGIPLHVSDGENNNEVQKTASMPVKEKESNTREKNKQKATSYSSKDTPRVAISDYSASSEKESTLIVFETGVNETSYISDQNSDNSAEDPSSENDSSSVISALRMAENEIKDDSKDQISDDSQSAGNPVSKEETIILTGGLKVGRNANTDLTVVQDHTTTATSSPKTTKFLRHMIQDDERIQMFIKHVYEQALKAFEAMKKKSDSYTSKKIDRLTEIYKEKFTDFVDKTRKAYIKTKQGTQNVILHTIDTSNLIMERIVNFLKTDVLGDTAALRQGGASILQKELDTVKALEFEHACKMYGICRSSNGFRNEILNIISTLLIIPDYKLLQANDAATEILKNADLSAFTNSSSILKRIKAAIKSYQRADATTLRKSLGVLFGVINQSHLPFIIDKNIPFQKHSVKRTVSFHNLLDGIEDALPPNELNKIEWESIANRLKRWADGAVSDVQATFQTLFNHINKGMKKYGERSEKIRELVEDIAGTTVED